MLFLIWHNYVLPLKDLSVKNNITNNESKLEEYKPIIPPIRQL